MVCWNKYLVPKNPFIKLKAINTALKKNLFRMQKWKQIALKVVVIDIILNCAFCISRNLNNLYTLCKFNLIPGEVSIL